MEITNEELVLRIQAGDNPKQNLEALYQQNFGFIKKAALRWTKTEQDLEDLIQEAYFVLLASVKNYDPKQEVKFITFFGRGLQRHFAIMANAYTNSLRIPQHMQAKIAAYNKYMADQEDNNIIPTDEMICEALKISMITLLLIRKTIYELTVFSTDVVIGEDTDCTLGECIPDSVNIEENVIQTIIHEQTNSMLWELVGTLTDVQSKLIESRYRNSGEKLKTYSELGKEFHFSKQRAWTIEKKALANLRRMKKIQELALINDYSIASLHTGVTAFRRHGSAIENAVIKKIEREEAMKKKAAKIAKDKKDMDKLFEQIMQG